MRRLGNQYVFGALLLWWFPDIHLMKRERDPTPEEFEKLLAWLAADRDEAGRKYEAIRNWLVRVFINRGCVDAETLADEVMNRVAVRIVKIVTTYDDSGRCFHGFAKNVCSEYRRDQPEVLLSEPPPQPPPPDERNQEALEQEDECLTQCIGELSTPESELFCRYFKEEKRTKINARKKLAVELRLTANGLRIKAHRLRRRLRRCMELCLKEFLGDETIRG